MNTRKTIVLSLMLICFVAVAQGVLAQGEGASLKANAEGSTSTGHFEHFKPEHRVVVEKWLAGRPGWRPAVEADCQNKFGVESLRSGEGNGHLHPYYAVGDLNGDRREDFAVALYHPRRRAASRFAIAIFNGGKGGINSVPAYFIADADFRQGGFWLIPQTETASWLAAGEYETDNGSYFKPRGRTYVAIALESGN